jgi:hypothetical protein
MRKLLTLGLSVALLSACTATAHLYPVQGPLSTRIPPPTLILKQSGRGVSVVLEDGEVCSGPFAILSPTDSSARELSTEWDLIYGSGYYLAHVLGTPIHRSTLVGNKGTTLEVENSDVAPVNSSGIATVVGVAKDSRGNIYKLNF